MQKVIHKQTLQLGSNQDTTLTLPLGAKVLSCREQNGQATLWYSWDGKTSKTQQKTFKVVYTGYIFELPSSAEFLATLQIGSLVYHVFQTTTPKPTPKKKVN